MITKLRKVALTLAATSLVVTPLQANVGDSMDRFMDDMGAAGNVTGPTAFQGQSAGYYSLGNVWTRFPQKTTNIANLQLPRARAGCGGIDIFAGSFSFINASEIVALLKAVANNAVGFAFSLAIDTVCPECSKIMQEFAQKAQLMNNLNINSCELAQGLVGGIWPKGDLADKAVCEAIGNSEGIFTDYAAAKHGCGTRGQRSSTLQNGNGKYDDVNPGVPRNYTWTILKKSAFFSPNGTFDQELAEYAMTLLGTIIYVPPTDDEPGKFVPIVGESSSTLVTSLLDGTTNGNVLIFHCDEPDKCLDPGFRSLNLPISKSLRHRVSVLINSMVQAVRTDTAITEAEKELLQVSSVPLYKILTVQAAYGRGMATDDRETLAELASIDLLFAVLDRIVSEAGRSMSSFIGADEAKIQMWQSQVNTVRQALADRQSNTHLKVLGIMQIIEKTAMIENMLAASMSPSMSASLDWSRALQSRSIVP
ncbi:conjugative transfer pilus assembly protein TraH [Erythromicrobium ramosum]|uniref:Conjugal transfer protein TraH n=1 Tax=Erythrobacter ramosus TaxID=35811 RepID=A0A6I4UFQ2_9SPHN|nr:conjugal transfer protein TraH [Erythrobacter ramosus]MBB3775034.1 conjugative transfer pilus assembly protein TraH [Erythrobacter ramosus]MXP37336.1 conjugal transfer protein TraH [Erythrobacter ramosus]